MTDQQDLADVSVTMTVTLSINVPVARHWGIRLDHPEEIENFVRNEVLPRDFDPEGPLAGLTVDTIGVDSRD